MPLIEEERDQKEWRVESTIRAGKRYQSGNPALWIDGATTSLAWFKHSLRTASLVPTVHAVTRRTSLSSNRWISLPASLTLPELSASFEASTPVESLDVLMIEII